MLPASAFERVTVAGNPTVSTHSFIQTSVRLHQAACATTHHITSQSEIRLHDTKKMQSKIRRCLH